MEKVTLRIIQGQKEMAEIAVPNMHVLVDLIITIQKMLARRWEIKRIKEAP